MYKSDPTYRFLHGRPVRRPPGRGHAKLAAGNVRGFSLAAKWCPSVDSSYDRSTLLGEVVARRLFPSGSSPELSAAANEDFPDAHHEYRARERLRKVALVLFRRALKLPEVYISALAWGAVAMKNYTDLFLKHDADRFNAYLADVKSGKKRIAAGALLPHEIVASLGDDNSEVPELQWRWMVDDTRALGTLANCVPVCDVSGSMRGVPMDVCVALGLLVSELSVIPSASGPSSTE
jgi:hypothetical protein